MMTISDFYSNEIVVNSYGKGRTYKIISTLREVWPSTIGIGRATPFPYYNKPVNAFVAAWIIFILSNSKSHSEQDVISTILRAYNLKTIGREVSFIDWFEKLLSDPISVESIKSISIFFNTDCCVSVLNEHEGGNLVFQVRDTPFFKIRRPMIIDGDFLLEISKQIKY
jgi:hypothetical protein